MISKIQKIIRGAIFAWSWRNTIYGSFTPLPDMPKSWQNSKQVQTWLRSVLESPLAVGFVLDTSVRWDDQLRVDLLRAVTTPLIWDTIFSFIPNPNPDVEKLNPLPVIPERKTIRERLARIIQFRKKTEATPETLLTPALLQAANCEVVETLYDMQGLEYVPLILNVMQIVNSVENYKAIRNGK